MRRTGFAVALGALLAVGGAGWLLWNASERDDDAGAQERSAPVSDRQGPLLTGRTSARGAGDADEGEFRVTGVVVDHALRPLAGVRVEATLGVAWPAPTVVDSAKSELERAFEAAPPAPPASSAAAASGEGGVFALTVRRRGQYQVRPAVEPPLVGMTETVDVRDAATERLTLHVRTGSAIRGRVVDASDAGVEAWVSAGWSDRQHAWRPPETATTAGTGAFLLPAVPDGYVEVTVRLPGRLVLTVSTKTPRVEELLIRLGTWAPLVAGTVRDLAGRPVPDARVGVTVDAAQGDVSGSGVEYLAGTDAQGRYRISGPTGGTVSRVRAEAAGYLALDETPPRPRWSGLSLDAGKEAALDLTLWRGGLLTGTVRERGTGTPLSGASVSVIADAVDGRLSHPGMLHGTSDAQGRYAVVGLPVGHSIVVVEHATHYLAALEALPHPMPDGRGPEIPAEVRPAPPPALTVFLTREGERAVRDLELERGLEITGRVEDPAGKPVEGAEVATRGLDVAMTWDLEGSLPERAPSARSDRDGRFVVTGLPPRRAWSFHATKKGWLGEPCAPFALAADAPPPDVVLRLVAGATLLGRVVDAEGNACAGVDLSAYSNAESGLVLSEDAEGQSGPDGSFRLEGVSPGSVYVWGGSRDHGDGNVQLDEVTAGEVREGVVLTLASKHPISGVLVDEQGRPLPWKRLEGISPRQSWWNASAVSGRDGTFQLRMGAPGPVRITPDGAPEIELALVEAPAKDVRITWKEPPSLVVEGLVTDPAGRAVPLCTVHVVRILGDRSRSVQAGGSVVNGWFRWHVRGGPPLTIAVADARDAAGRRLNLRDEDTLLPEVPAGPVTIALEPGLVVAGRVLDPLGRPVAGALVRSDRIRETTDDRGAFRLGGLSGDSVGITCHPLPPWLPPPSQTVAVGTEDVVFRLEAGRSIAGTVVDPASRRVTEAWVEARWPDTPQMNGGLLETGVGRDGRFLLEGIPADALVTVTAQDEEENYPRRVVTGVRPGTEDLIVDLGAGVAVEGIVVDAEGRPFSRGSVEFALNEDGDESLDVDLAEDGTFRIAGLSPGPVWISAGRDDGGRGTGLQRFEAPATKVRLVLPPTAPLSGRLVGTGGTPWALWAWDTADPNEVLHTQPLDSEGRFSFEGAGASGTWMVGARPQAKTDDRYALAGPVPAGTRDLTLEVRAGRPIEGTLMLEDGKPADRLSIVWAVAEGMPWRVWARPDEQGRFVIRGLAPARYRITGHGQNDPNLRAERDGVTDGTRDMKLVLSRVGR